MVCPLPQQNETPGTAAKKVKSNDMDRKGRGKRGVFCFFFQNAARKVGKKIHRGLSFWARSNFACPLHLHRFSFSVQTQLQNWAGERTNERELLVLRRRVPLAGFLVLLGVLLLGLLLQRPVGGELVSLSARIMYVGVLKMVEVAVVIAETNQ